MSSAAASMSLRVLLPHGVLLERDDVRTLTVESHGGGWGILPRRQDCVCALDAGLLLYTGADGIEQALAIDEGVLVKVAAAVTVAVRDAIAGATIDTLRHTVEHEFRTRAARESEVSAALARLESGFVRRFTELQHG